MIKFFFQSQNRAPNNKLSPLINHGYATMRLKQKLNINDIMDYLKMLQKISNRKNHNFRLYNNCTKDGQSVDTINNYNNISILTSILDPKPPSNNVPIMFCGCSHFKFKNIDYY